MSSYFYYLSIFVHLSVLVRFQQDACGILCMYSRTFCALSDILHTCDHAIIMDNVDKAVIVCLSVHVWTHLFV